MDRLSCNNMKFRDIDYHTHTQLYGQKKHEILKSLIFILIKKHIFDLNNVLQQATYNISFLMYK